MNDGEILDSGAETFTFKRPPATLRVQSAAGVEVILIESDGRLFWHGREVETDDDFRAAMLELRDYFMGKR